MLTFQGNHSLGNLLLTGVSGIALLGALAAPAPAAAQTWNAGTSNWNNAGNWTPNTVPNSSGASATVNNGGTANVDGGFSVGTLTVGNTSAVTINNAEFLQLFGSIANSGLLTLGSGGSTTELLIGGGQTVTLSGGGTVSLSNNSNNLIRDASLATGRLINVDNLIEGSGNIGFGQLSLDNQSAGIINGNQSTALTLQPNAAGVTNEGLIEASNGGSLQLVSGTFDQTGGGTLLATGASSVLSISNSTVTGGKLTTQSGGTIQLPTGTQSTLNNGTITGGSTLTVSNGSDLVLGGSLVNNGTVVIQSSGSTTELRIGGGQTVSLTGGGTVSLTDNSNNLIRDPFAATGHLININNLIQGAGNIGFGQLSLDNQAAGIIDANAATHSLVLQPNGSGFSNEGLMRATNTGGLVLSGGQIVNKGGTISAVGAGNNVYLQSGVTVSGGLLTSSGGGNIQMVAGHSATLDGSSNGAITNAGTFQDTNGAATFVSGTLNNTGTLVVGSTGSTTDLRFADGSTLTGGGQIVLTDNNNNRIFGTANTGQETVTNANNTISGAGQLGASASVEFINQGSGVVNANGTHSLVISPTTNSTITTPNGGGFVNQGLLESTNSGGLVLNGGQINNLGGTISAIGTSTVGTVTVGNNVYLQSSVVVSGGRLTSSGGAIIQTVAGNAATLDGSSQGTITNAGTFQDTNSSTTIIDGTLNNTGTVLVNSNGSTTDLRIADGTTLTGNGQLVLSDNGNNRVFGNANSGTETFTNLNNTISGAGQLGASASIEFINRKGGVVDANGTHSLVVSPTTNGTITTPNGGGFVNQGLMEATNTGGLVLNGGQFNNFGGTILASGNGNNVYLQTGAVVSGGLLNTTGGGVVQTVTGQSATLDGSSQGAITNAGTFVGTNNSTTFLNGTINNTGSLLVASTGSTTDLRIANGTTLTGNGVVQLSDNGNNRIWGNANSGTEVLTNANNTITGAGQFGVSASIEFINQKSGVVDASGTNALVLTPTTNPGVVGAVGGGFVNQGLMEATNSGGLVFNGGQTNNKGGTIAAVGAGNNVDLQVGAVISGGLLTGSGGGIEQTVAGQAATLDGSSQGAITNAGTFRATNNSTTFLDGTINNTGTMLLNSTGSTTDMRIADGTTLTGGGVLVLSDNNNNRIWGATNSGAEVLTNANNTIEGAGQFGVSASIGIVNGGTIASTGAANALVISPSTSGSLAAGLLNQAGGVVESGAGSAGLVITQGSVNNQGTMQALDGSSLTYNPAVTNLNASGGTLAGGTWNAIATGKGATLSVTGGPITTDAANITLSGIGSAMQAYNGTKYIDIQNSLTSIASGGQLHVLNNQNYTTANDIANAGLLDLGGGTFTSNSLNNSGTLSGFGTQTSSAGALTNSGSVVATGGRLVLAQGVTGTTGNVTIDNGASLDISGAAAGNTVGTLLHNGANLNLGSKNVTVSQDYNSSNFGVGNSFNNHGSVTGGGSILAAGNTGLAVTGADIAGGTLSLGNVHVGVATSTAIDISNTGTAGPVLRGAVQNSGISSGALTLTAQNYGPIALGGTQIVNLGFDPGSAGALAGQSFKVVTNFDNVASKTVNVTGAAFDLANPIVNPGTINFGNHHVGEVVAQQALTIQNSTITSAAFQEGLDASFGSAGSGITTNGGSITNLAAGTSNNSSMKLGISTGSAGAINGSATLNLASNGATTSNLGITSLPGQSVTVTGGVYNLATSSAIAPINFGVLHVGDGGGSETKALSISNTAPSGLFSEGLDSSFGSYTAGGGDTLTPTFSGGINNLAAGSTDSSSMKVSISTASAGTFNGKVAVNQASNGSVDGLANTPLGSQNVGVSGNVTVSIFNFATAQVNNAPLSFGNVRIGSAVANQAISVSNTAPLGPFSENLDASVIPPLPGGFTASGSFNGLAPGATDASSLVVGLDSSKAGAHSGNVTLGLVSDGSSVAGDGTTTPLANQTVAVSGNVYRLANPIVNTPSITLAARVGGALPTANVSVSDSSPDGFTEGLKTSFGSAPVGFTNSGSIGNLAAQGTDGGSLSVGLASTAASGVTTGSATLNNISTGNGTDNAADISVGSSSVSLTGKVYQTATASVTPSVNFGIVHVGDTVTNQAINVANTASGALVDSVTGSISSVSAPFSNGGGSLGAGVTAGGNSNALTVGMNTGAAGVFSGSATLSLASHDSDLSDVSLITAPVTLNGQVNNYAGIGLSNASSGALSGGGAAYKLNLGTLLQGSSPISAALDALNAVLGPADALAMNTFNVLSGGGLFNITLNAFSGLAAGATDGNALDVGFDPTGTGAFQEVIQLVGSGSNTSGWDSGLNVLDPTLTIDANVVGSSGVPEPPSWWMMLAGLVGLGAVARRSRQRRR